MPDQAQKPGPHRGATAEPALPGTQAAAPEAAPALFVALPDPFDLERTLGSLRYGRDDPTTWIEAGRAWRATRTADGPATLCFSRLPGGCAVEAAGPGAALALELAPRLLGRDDDPTALVPRHQLLRDLAHRFAGVRLSAGLPVSEAVQPWVLGQRVTTVEAKASWAALVRAHGEPAPLAPTLPPPPRPLHLPPEPRRLARRDPADLARFGIDRARALALLEACRHHRRLDAAAALPAAEAHATLVALRGIGPWTAAHTLAAAMGDPDAVPVGDYHLPSLVAWALAGEARADDARMLALLEPWRGQRWRLVRLLAMAGLRAPRFGPRRPPRRL